jgi:hypothetical protein
MCCPSYHFDLECDCGCALPDPACGGLGCTDPGCVAAACAFSWNGPAQAACP